MMKHLIVSRQQINMIAADAMTNGDGIFDKKESFLLRSPGSSLRTGLDLHLHIILRYKSDPRRLWWFRLECFKLVSNLHAVIVVCFF